MPVDFSLVLKLFLKLFWYLSVVVCGFLKWSDFISVLLCVVFWSAVIYLSCVRCGIWCYPPPLPSGFAWTDAYPPPPVWVCLYWCYPPPCMKAIWRHSGGTLPCACISVRFLCVCLGWYILCLLIAAWCGAFLWGIDCSVCPLCCMLVPCRLCPSSVWVLCQVCCPIRVVRVLLLCGGIHAGRSICGMCTWLWKPLYSQCRFWAGAPPWLLDRLRFFPCTFLLVGICLSCFSGNHMFALLLILVWTGKVFFGCELERLFSCFLYSCKKVWVCFCCKVCIGCGSFWSGFWRVAGICVQYWLWYLDCKVGYTI